MDRMDLSPILSVIHTVAIDTVLNSNGGNNGHGLKTVTCRQTFKAWIKSLGEWKG